MSCIQKSMLLVERWLLKDLIPILYPVLLISATILLNLVMKLLLDLPFFCLKYNKSSVFLCRGQLSWVVSKLCTQFFLSLVGKHENQCNHGCLCNLSCCKIWFLFSSTCTPMLGHASSYLPHFSKCPLPRFCKDICCHIVIRVCQLFVYWELLTMPPCHKMGMFFGVKDVDFPLDCWNTASLHRFATPLAAYYWFQIHPVCASFLRMSLLSCWDLYPFLFFWVPLRLPCFPHQDHA